MGRWYHDLPEPRSLLIAVLLLACDSGQRRGESAPSASVTTNTNARLSGSTASRDSAAALCPPTGMWALCSVEKRLRQSGFVAKRVRGESTQRPGFAVSPVVYTLGRARLEVFIYPNEMALRSDIRGLDTVTATPPGKPGTWETPPVLIRSMNLAAVLLTDNQRQAERLMLALTAGAPQPNLSR